MVRAAQLGLGRLLFLNQTLEPQQLGDDWRATRARRSVPGCVNEFAIHRAAIDSFLKRAQSLRLEERVGLASQSSASEKRGSRYPSPCPT